MYYTYNAEQLPTVMRTNIPLGKSTHHVLGFLLHIVISKSNFSRQTSSSESQISKELEPLKNYMSSVTLSEIKSWNDSGSEARGETDSSDASRRESMASRSMSELMWSDTRSEDKMSPSTCSINSSVFKNSLDDKAVDTSMGIIELSLTYDAVSTRLRTKTVHKSRNPEFNENLTFYDITENDLVKRSLHILMVDDDKYGHDYMGETRINLAKLKVQNTIYLTVPFEKSPFRAEGTYTSTRDE
ncbi:hypothetical protein NQ317_012450 [Molorchus minor]|uniref:C2 domain-containing protein n=1 Tax=Molorchus minor TaxID=1323400 RepID=A0ABQ9J123_9CUCU|nr:hypothetical protein NQ317_012450 [Molorchus minor]